MGVDKIQCKGCGNYLYPEEQEQRNAPPLQIFTCRNRGCSLWSVTLSAKQYEILTDEQWDNYRQMVKKLKSFYNK